MCCRLKRGFQLAVAGLDYTPDILESPRPNIANSHVRGYRAELELANRVAALSDEVVIKYGDKIGRNGSDVISVNRKTGNVVIPPKNGGVQKWNFLATR